MKGIICRFYLSISSEILNETPDCVKRNKRTQAKINGREYKNTHKMLSFPDIFLFNNVTWSILYFLVDSPDIF